MEHRGENITATVGGAAISYHDMGPVSAPAVVFLHGFPMNKNMWDLQVELLKSNYRVIAPDFHNFGLSGPKMTASLDSMAEDVVAFLDYLQLKSVIACGHSLGGQVLLHALSKFPDRFHAAAFVSTQCGREQESLVKEHRKLATRILNYNIENYADELLPLYFSQRSFITRKEEVRKVREMIITTPVDSIFDGVKLMSQREDVCMDVKGLRLPVLLISGSHDQLVPPNKMEAMHQYIRGSEFQRIDYGGAMVNLENTHEFNLTLRKFVERICLELQLSVHCAVN